VGEYQVEPNWTWLTSLTSSTLTSQKQLKL
jgi:hypothetical protein